MEQQENEKLYTVKEVAKELRCNPETVKRYIYADKIKAVKIMNKWKISGAEVERIKRGE